MTEQFDDLKAYPQLTMHAFVAEVLKIFPELRGCTADYEEDLPFAVGGNLVQWLGTQSEIDLLGEVAQRLMNLQTWCTQQPANDTDDSDMFSIFLVSVIEDLFSSDELIKLIPKLSSRAELLANREYLVPWIGHDRYEVALNLPDWKHCESSRRQRKKDRRINRPENS